MVPKPLKCILSICISFANSLIHREVKFQGAYYRLANVLWIRVEVSIFIANWFHSENVQLSATTTTETIVFIEFELFRTLLFAKLFRHLIFNRFWTEFFIEQSSFNELLFVRNELLYTNDRFMQFKWIFRRVYKLASQIKFHLQEQWNEFILS